MMDSSSLYEFLFIWSLLEIIFKFIILYGTNNRDYEHN
jgi:hypothetical protein